MITVDRKNDSNIAVHMQGCSSLQNFLQVVKQTLFCCFRMCESAACKCAAWWFHGVVMGVQIRLLLVDVCITVYLEGNWS